MDLRQRLDRILPFVRKPQRYLGGEIHSVRKDPATVKARVALCYPDLYEIGASNTGLQILYHVVNRDPRFAAERAYMPDLDLRDRMKAEALPLFSLESFTPLREFDLVGFTLQCELTYPDIVEMLRLSGIPVKSAERNAGDPYIILGGPLAVNPEPLALLADAVVVGDGEETLPTLLEIAAARHPRSKTLEAFAALAGVYVPAHPPAAFKPARVGALEPGRFPDKPLIPLLEPVHCRFALEIMRGCTHGCRFCSAGYYYRPLREFDAGAAAEAVKGAVADGWREISLLSLSTADYSALPRVLDQSLALSTGRQVHLSLPSTRLDKVTAGIFDRLGLAERSGITFAPEAGSERLRNSLNKPLTDGDILSGIRLALEKGLDVVKLYFMVGLPGETLEDVKAAAGLINEAAALFRPYGGRRSLHVAVSPFSPKPGTPFEREPLMPEEEIVRRALMIKSALRFRFIQFRWHDGKTAKIETLLSRGGRDLFPLLDKASETGLSLQSWQEHFDLDRWLALAAECGLDPVALTGPIADTASLPWERLRSPETSRYLLEERDKARNGELTEDCRHGCPAPCGACIGANDHHLAEKNPVQVAAVPAPAPTQPADAVTFFYRVDIEKNFPARFIPYRDVTRLLERALRAAGLPLCYSQGFSPHPKISSAYPLPLGMAGLREPLFIELGQSVEPDLLLRANAHLPEGLRLNHPGRAPRRFSLESVIRAAVYEAHPGDAAFNPDRLAAFQEAKEWPAEIRQKSGNRTLDLKPLVLSLSLDSGTLMAVLVQTPDRHLRLSDVLTAIFGLSPDEVLLCRSLRTGFLISGEAGA